MIEWTKHERQNMLSAESIPRFEDARKNPKAFDDLINLRRALLDFIADFCNWDNSTSKEFLHTSRELTKIAHESLGGVPGTHPLVIDPFAGGGSIPVETLRIGADSFASDLNPIPILLNKVLLEYIPKYGDNLVDDIHKWGAWIKKMADKDLAEFYPKDEDGAIPIAYLWARTIRCEGPKCGVTIPLIRTLNLSKDYYLSLKENSSCAGFNVFIQKGSRSPQSPTVSGGSATCPKCAYTTSAKAVKKQLSDKQGGANDAQLLAVCCEANGTRRFRAPTLKDSSVIKKSAGKIKDNETFSPMEEINEIRPYGNTRGLSAVTRIGIKKFAHLYTPRQVISLRGFCDAISNLQKSGQIEERQMLPLITIFGLAFGRLVHQNCSISRWQNNRGTVAGAFGKQALQITWDFAEVCPLSQGPGSWGSAIEWIVRIIEANRDLTGTATVEQCLAKDLPLPDDIAAALVTDPPYFAAIPYSDLANFFYVWLRKIFVTIYPSLFAKPLIDQSNEIIVTNANAGPNGEVKDQTFFEREMTASLDKARKVLMPSGIGVIVFADTKTESWEAILSAVIAAGWIVTGSWPLDTELQGRTQAQNAASLQSSIHIICRPRENSDGHLRIDEIGDWRDVLTELPRRIHEWMPRLAEEGVVGADAIFACLGPALEIFSRYSRVEKASGETVTLKEYLEQVWAAVAKEALSLVFKDANTTGFESDARLTAMWLWTLNTNVATADAASNEDDEKSEDEEELGGKGTKTKSGFVLEFDAARKIAQGLGADLEKIDHLVEVKGETARLIPVNERARYLFGKEGFEGESVTGSGAKRKKKNEDQKDFFLELMGSDEAPVEAPKNVAIIDKDLTGKPGATVLDKVHQSMILFAVGRGEALKRFLVEDGVGQDQRFWHLAQALSALYPATCEEKRWVDGVLARKKGLGF